MIIATSVKKDGCPQAQFRADSDLGWRAPSQWFPHPEQAWRHWLLDSGSLTQRLMHLSGGQFKVRVMEEGWSRQHSAPLLPCFGSRMGEQIMWSRRVTLMGDSEPWVYAHSLIPVSSLQGKLRQLSKLQSKPLGAFLFSHPTLVRSQLEIARAGNGWGRRSVFNLYGKPLLVAEFFLPALLDYQQQRENVV